MRVLMVLTAMVATPFFVSAAQGRSAESPKSGLTAVRHGDEQPGDDRSDKRVDGKCKEKHANKGHHKGWRHGQHDDCDQTPPPSTTGSIQGTVFYDMSYDGVRDADESGIANWTIMLSGPVTATTFSDANGNYSFTGLPDGTYTVCEAQRFGWIQTAPQGDSSCTSGFGYTVVISGGGVQTLLDFGDVG